MSKDFIHTSNSTPPRTFQQPKLVPVILKLKECYGDWQKILAIFPKSTRYTLGSKIDDVFLNTIEFSFLASYSTQLDKMVLLDRSIARLDLLKLLIQLCWDIQAIDNKKFIEISEKLSEIGKMLGGWKKSLQTKTPELNREK